ncbi:MAG: membrane-bound lytic murein transglycosylase A [Planctomycetota bacterium]|jgi:membrane-bound lytic murein transglycosylase A
MLRRTALFVLPLILVACRSTPDYGRPLPRGAAALLELGPLEATPDLRHTWIDRDELDPALQRSIAWTDSDYAKQFFPIAGIDHERALTSLRRLREILFDSPGPSAFQAAIDREFTWYKSAGWDGKGGGVLYTGYCTPILPGAVSASAEYHHPLYALPPDLKKGPKGKILGQITPAGLVDYPARRTIEANGLLAGKGLELVWLKDPIDAYIAHVNGSAFIELKDGSMLRFGYAGKNGREYTSLGKELINDGHVEAADMNLGAIRAWAKSSPDLINDYLSRNDSYVFFTPIDGNPRGSLNVEVSDKRSLATDKRLFPRGAPVFIDTNLPTASGSKSPFRRLMFDQDTGGAIRTAGRADIYLGIGPEAEELAGLVKAEGQLYYLFLR